MIVYSDRDVPVGAHVTHETKIKLRQLADKHGKSMSAIIAEAIDAKLYDATHDGTDSEDHPR